jgi:lysyl-tRNA synthetase class 2
MTLRRGATIGTLEARAELLTRTRSWFASRGILEVETASLSAAASPDPAIESLQVLGSNGRRFLHTSPEYMMKRLLADGIGDIYQLCRVWRDGEIGRWHEPEFMLLEWYRVGIDEHALMSEVEQLLGELLTARQLATPAERISYDEALLAALGITSRSPPHEISAALLARDIEVPAETGHDALLDLAVGTIVSRGFAPNRLTFVHDYPASQAALARIRAGDPPTAARFEVYLGAVELGNGFCELTDAAEQRTRFARENATRERAGQQPVPVDECFLQALADGLPECSGVALGFDRIVAAALDAGRLSDVLAFTHSSVNP